MWQASAKSSHKLYTGKGDNGTTKLFDCPPGVRIPKSSPVFEALGVLDELNSSLGYAKALSQNANLNVPMDKKNTPYEEVINNLQKHLFCIQAELGGSEVRLKKEHLSYLENIVGVIENLLPPINSFIIAGGGQASAYLDVARAISRKVERQVVILRDSRERKVSDDSIAYLNRLSSILYALARFANYQQSQREYSPDYK